MMLKYRTSNFCFRGYLKKRYAGKAFFPDFGLKIKVRGHIKLYP
jgi:hypothetical protein